MIDPDVINDFNGWLYVVARSLSSDVNIREDLMQEGRVAMWQCLGKFDPDKGSLPAWMKLHARQRMLSIVMDGVDRKRTWLGVPLHEQRSIPRGEPANTPMDPLDYAYSALAVTSLPDSACMAGHRAEIRNALAELPLAAREAVFRKFWLDEPVPKHAWDRYSPVLARKLRHLKATVDKQCTRW